jgi:signal transduction histidine kinase
MPIRKFLASQGRTLIEKAAGRSAQWLVPVIYLVAAITFILDIVSANTLAYGLMYAPLVATSVFHKKRSSLWILTCIACALAVIGAFFPLISPNLSDLMGNRSLSILTILATAAFVQHTRDIQDRLTAQTRRAEAAERIKTRVLNNLTEDIRTPLHALNGVLTLTMASSTPDQRELLGRVRNDAKELLATIDNLIDLTQIDEHALRIQEIDVARIARDAATRAGVSARERQITIAVKGEPDSGRATAAGDSWAMRRILDNLLANAVRTTPAGGSVLVSVTRDAGTVTASVSDTGAGLAVGLTDDTALQTAGGTGLALSLRLARAMNGELKGRTRSGRGATVSLSLPAA